MKKIIGLALTLLLLLQLILVPASAYSIDQDGYVFRASFFNSKKSKDGKYEYYFEEETKEASFVRSFEDDITVVEIPEEIDGYPVVSISFGGTLSPSAVRIKYANTIKYVCMYALGTTDKAVPICMIDMNEGLESIGQWSTDEESVPLNCKALIFPSTLEYIGEDSVCRGFCENIVFQSNPVTKMNSVTVADGPYAYDPDINYQEEINFYFTGDATNLSPFTFNYQIFNDFRDLKTPDTYPTRGVTVYKKPGAQGFEKFLDSSYEEYISDLTYDWSIPEYTVKEYTEEWWHDLAEIETVTMTAEGMTEITENKGKGLSDAAKKYLSHEYEKSVKSGEAFTVSSSFAPADAYDDRTFFVSMNEDIATVDIETGEVKALKKGTARIRCVAASGVFADCILTVDGGDGTNGVAPTEADVEANDTNSAATTAAKTDTPTATPSQTQPNKALSFLADNKFYIIPAAVVLTAAVVAGCIVRKKKR